MRNQKFGTEYHRNYYYKRKQAIIDHLGGCCTECGSTSNLEVDHIDRNQKKFSINRRLSVKNNLDELTKCQLLCWECHRAKTSKENSGFKHGTMYAFWRKRCGCDVCLTAKAVYATIRNAKRRKAR